MTSVTHEYDPKAIEGKWQNYWLANKTFRVTEDTTKPKYYVLDMFPYPSGSGLHVGHPEGYTATDIVSRFKRMQGFNVLHPMGWDAFGLPAEQHAVKTGTHPAVTTKQNIDNFRRQIRALGFSYDWDREINTTDVSYYKWTQWIFLKLFEQGLAYQSYEPVNWCEELGTVLANEEVIDGKSEVGGFDVIKKPMRQWVLKITAYAERLLTDLEDLDWPESIKEMQRHWIGKSTGAEVRFQVAGDAGQEVTVFTTRPDTLFGATYFVLAPEHPLVSQVTTPEQRPAIDAYLSYAAGRSDRDRIADTTKTGAFTGGYVINPANQERLPIYIADYVLISYGHGAIMAVPGHDERDFAFAKTFDLPIKQVITPDGSSSASSRALEAPLTGDGVLINSGFLDGKTKDAAIAAMCQWLEDQNLGKRTVTYKLRDWLFSRQRYWGEPIPLVLDKDGNAHPLAASDLPLVLPEVDDYTPDKSGDPPLSRATEWLQVPGKGDGWRRETNTMPQWAGSCWYYLRYIDPTNNAEPWAQAKENYWMPVDLYVGGVEHAVLHLLYARFWHKVLYDLQLVSTKEPFQKLVNQGMILGENGEKMSKSRGNVVNPDDVIQQWGADAFRVYEMFMGPLEATKPWNTDAISGSFRFLQRLWRLLVDSATGDPSQTTGEPSTELTKALHKTIKKVTEDTEAMRFNTAIAAMMELVNQATKEKTLGREGAEALIKMIATYAPHMGEELWQRYGHPQTVAYEPWPTFDPALTVDATVTISVSVNGKLRGTMETSKQASKDAVLAQARALDGVVRQLAGKTVVKEIFVPGKIVNFVVKPS